MHLVHRYHDISAGHRVHGHESKCRHLHGHNYRIHFTCAMDTSKDSKELGLDELGRVIDFSVIKERLCMWLEDNWDHKFLHWESDPVIDTIKFVLIDEGESRQVFKESLVSLPFNPTAENMAQHLVEVVGPAQLLGTGVTLIEVKVEETAKCHASYRV